ncbi:hypothetical protein [Streptomyces cucumeris]|uniref:hypothetical protein n=1 Tax=Streptomyces cucumeris TaxID=2962890 RepID=UPI003D74D67D
MAARKPNSTRRTTRKTTAPAKCSTCKGTGETTTAVCVGRGRRITDDHQTGLCPDCLGIGTASS